jgi:hypothetical protein
VHFAPLKYKEKEYDLSHLRPKTVSFMRSAQGMKRPIGYLVDVNFSFHCFTREYTIDENPDQALVITHGKETRVFDFERWKLSHKLPGIIAGLMNRKCFPAGHRNFLTVEIPDHVNKSIVDYSIFFQVSRASRKGALNLYVQSAHMRKVDKERHNPPVAFSLILHKALSK